MGFLPSPIKLSPCTQIAPFDVRSLDLIETYKNLHISYTFAPRRWPCTQIAPFDVRSLDLIETCKNLYLSYTFAPRRWPCMQIAAFDVRSLDLTEPIKTYIIPILLPLAGGPARRLPLLTSAASTLLNLQKRVYFLHFCPSPVALHADCPF